MTEIDPTAFGFNKKHKPVKAPVEGPELQRLRPHQDVDIIKNPERFEDHDAGPERPKVNVGRTDEGNDVYYDPYWPDARLSNAHVAITGSSGTGKTQIMKTMVVELKEQGVKVLVLDFKDDYSDVKFSTDEGFQVFDPTHVPLPFNPLTPPVDLQTGEVNTVFHAYRVAEIISRVYGLGEQQSFALREAIKSVYQDAGLHDKPFVPKGVKWPTFDQVKEKLKGSKDNAGILGRLSPIFDFGFFSGEEAGSFDQVASSNVVIRLAALPGNEIKNAVAELFLMGLYNHLVVQPQKQTLASVLVLDEAWRVVNSPFLEPLLREGRAFGLGVFVASQFPTDLPNTVGGTVATQLFFGQSTPDQISEIERIIAGHTWGADSDRIGDTIRDLPPLSCLFFNRQYRPFVVIKARPYFLRVQDRELRTPGHDLNASKGRPPRVAQFKEWEQDRKVDSYGPNEHSDIITSDHNEDKHLQPESRCQYCMDDFGHELDSLGEYMRREYPLGFGRHAHESDDHDKEAPGWDDRMGWAVPTIRAQEHGHDWDMECEKCGEQFPHDSDLVEHYLAKHPPLQPKESLPQYQYLKCPYCKDLPKDHSDVHGWTGNIRTHWMCQSCGKEGERDDIYDHAHEERSKAQDYKDDHPGADWDDPNMVHDRAKPISVTHCQCGEKVIGGGFTNTCDKCGADYGGNGELLAPRSQWGAETGETYEQIKDVDDKPVGFYLTHPPNEDEMEENKANRFFGGMLGERGDWWKYPAMNEGVLKDKGATDQHFDEINKARAKQGLNPWADQEEMLDTIHLRREPKKVPEEMKTGAKYICIRCGGTTQNADKVCEACLHQMPLWDNTDSDTNTATYNTEKAVGDPEFPWQKDSGWKNADLIPFPPGRDDEEEGWFMPYDIVNDQIVESPRRKRVSGKEE